jgi:hypothetical protein
MTIALRVPDSSKARRLGFARLASALGGGFRWFWWHARAYGIILGIMLLTFLSLVVLQFHWFSRKFSWVLRDKTINTASK